MVTEAPRQPSIIFLCGNIEAEGFGLLRYQPVDHRRAGGLSDIMSLEAGWCQLIWCRSGWFGFVPMIQPDGFAPAEPGKTTSRRHFFKNNEQMLWVIKRWILQLAITSTKRTPPCCTANAETGSVLMLWGGLTWP